MMHSPGAIARRAVYDVLRRGWAAAMEAESEQYGIAPLPLSFGGGGSVEIALRNAEDIPESRLVGPLTLCVGTVGSTDDRAGQQTRRFASFSGPVTVALQFLYRQQADDVEDLMVERAEFAADAIEGTLVSLFGPSVALPPRVTYIGMSITRDVVVDGGDYYYKPVRAEITFEVDV